MNAETSVLQRVASFGLRPEAEPLPLPRPAWSRAGARLVAARIAGLALAAVDVGAIEPPVRIVDRLRRAQDDAMLRCLDLERRLLAVVARLRDGGIDPLVLKGSALAHASYPDPAWRPFLDIDLLVRRPDRRRASEILSRAGYVPVRPSPRPAFDDRFAKAVVHRCADGAEIDLHRTIADGPFGVWIDADELTGMTVPWALADEPMRRLDDTGLFLHACVHAALGTANPGWIAIRDVAQTALRGRVDWRRAGELSARWRIAAVVRRSLETVRSRLAVELPAEAWAAAGDVDEGQARALRAYSAAARVRGGPAIATVHALPTLRERAAYVGALTVPSRAFLEARGQVGSRALLARWGRAARWLWKDTGLR